MAETQSASASHRNDAVDVEVEDDVLEYLRRLVLSDEHIVRRFRNLISTDYNRILEKCLRLSRENHDHVTELQRLRTHNLALLEENQQLKEKQLVLLESVRSSTEENHRLVSENVALARSPAARLLRKQGGGGGGASLGGSSSAAHLNSARPVSARASASPAMSARPSARTGASPF